MASLRKHRDKWQAQVRLKGTKPIARSFQRKSDAIAWSRVVESEITLGTYVDPRSAENTTLSDVISHYRERLAAIGTSNPPLESRLERLKSALGTFSLSKLSTQNLSKYRDQRLLAANPATVCHELGLIKRLLRFATTDLDVVLPRGIPVVSMPKMPRGRIRRLSKDEEGQLLSVCEHDPILRDFFSLALETGMRRSEIVRMKRGDIDWNRSTLYIPITKNGEPREIPLTDEAKYILKRRASTRDRLFQISNTSISQRFARACKRAQIMNLRLHDLRHEAISRFFELGLNQIEVASISGHRSPKMLQRYVHLDAARLQGRMLALKTETPDF